MATQASVLNRTEEERRAQAEHFRKLADRWDDETAVFSSNSQIREHPAFNEIVAMGNDAIPLLLDRLREPSITWMIALTAIVGDSPVSNEHAGRIVKMAGDWLAWGAAHGYATK